MNAPATVLFTVTDAHGVAHLVTEDAMTAGRSTGRYAAVCGSTVLAASLTTLERGHCRPCRRGRTGQ